MIIELKTEDYQCPLPSPPRKEPKEGAVTVHFNICKNLVDIYSLSTPLQYFQPSK